MTDDQIKKLQLQSIERRLAMVKTAIREVHSPPKKVIKQKNRKKMIPDMSLICHLRQLYFEGVKRHNEIEFQNKKQKKPPVIDIEKVATAANKIVEKPATRKQWGVDPPIHADEKKIIVRPPAIYTNTPSPYGIADELHSNNLSIYS